MVSLDVQVATKHASAQSLNVWATEIEIIVAASELSTNDMLFFIIRGHLQMAACEIVEERVHMYKKHKQSFCNC